MTHNNSQDIYRLLVKEMGDFLRTLYFLTTCVYTYGERGRVFVPQTIYK